MHLRDLLTIQQPLGPIRHETIMKRSGNGHHNTLIYETGLFHSVLDDNRPLIIGRRGSGKTAIVSALVARSSLEAHHNHPGDIYVLIDSWSQLDQLVEKVGLDARHSIGSDSDWSSLLAETVARHWARRLWMVIFDRLYSYCMEDDALRMALSPVVKYVEGRDVVPNDREITDELLNTKFRQIREVVLTYLKDTGKQCVIVIDSLDEYPILAPRFRRLIAGMLKFVNDLNSDFANVRVVCCIPEEIEPFFAAQASNYLKDLADPNVSRLRWRPIDLLRIVAERYRAFLSLYCDNDNAFLDKITRMDFARRRDLREFYLLVMPDTITNRLGRQEPAIAYILRHTQLLPREFLMIFDAAIVRSHKSNGSWRNIVAEEIVRAVEIKEPMLVNQVMQPYRTIYPELLRASQMMLPELSPICTLGDLDRVKARFGKACEHETEYPLHTLFEIGVIGYVDEQATGEFNERYEYGRFHFNSVKPITFANGRKYCVHPIFSGSWGLQRTDDRMKCVYPADVEEIPLEA